ncbi:MAG: hypothetical protein JNM07_04530 [Phycisphaerae bacterium]|nr:hypothetical protein [Phycisphaerae bacterium]
MRYAHATIMLAMAAATCAPARAGFIDAAYTGVAAGRNVSLTVGASTFDTFAGQIGFTLSNGSGDAATLNGSRLMFCADPYQRVSSSSQRYERLPIESLPVSSGVPTMGGSKAQALRDIYAGTSAAAFQAGASADAAAAFQIAIWEIIVDYDPVVGPSSIDPASGALRARSSGSNQLASSITAQFDLLRALIGRNLAAAGLVGLGNPSYQDQVMQIPSPGSVALLLGAGLSAIVPRRGRSSRAAATVAPAGPPRDHPSSRD